MKKIVTIGIILLALILSLYIVIHSWNKRYDEEMVNQMNCGITASDVRIELISDDRGGLTGDGATIYKVLIDDDYDINKMDFSSWKNLPVNEKIVDTYMVNEYPAGSVLSKLKKGSWKIVGKNKEYGMYSNIVLYVYDEENRCIYIYKWDS